MRAPTRWARFAALDRRVYVIGASGLIRYSGRSATFLFLPIWLYTEYHLAYVEVGLLIASVVPIAVGANLAGGALSDRIGRRPLSWMPAFGSSACFLGMYVAATQGVPTLIVLWAAQTLLANLQQPAQSALLGDVTSPEDRLTAFGLQRVAGNAGFALSPAIGGILATHYGLPVIFLMASTATVSEGIVLFALLAESHRPTRATRPATAAKAPPTFTDRLRLPFRDPFLVGFGLLGFLLALATAQFGTGLSLYLTTVRSVSLEEMGYLYATNGLIVVALQIPITWVLVRRPLRWMAIGTLAYGVAFLVFLLGRTFPERLAAMSVLTVGEDVVSPVQNQMISAISSHDRRGSYFGAYNMFTNSAQALGPPIGTLLLGIGPTPMWLGFSGLTGLTAAGYLALERSPRRPAPTGTPAPPS